MGNPLTLRRVTVPIETLDIIDLDERHLKGALALSVESHWNQVEADWQMMLAAGNAIGIEADNRLIATALILPFGDHFGWISMVLVTADWQKKGLATRLLKTCIERLESQGLTPVLDATLAGENVYRPLGFVAHFGIGRWQHDSVEDIGLAGVEIDPLDKANILRVDQAVFGGERMAILASLITRSAEFAIEDKLNNGYLLGRDGRVASQLGPIFSDSEDSAIEMLNHALANLQGPVFIDACDHQTAFVAQLKQYGFTLQRSFLRMAKNEGTYFGDRQKMFAMAGPELG